ncbi:SanA/YdcF family protein [Carnimonas bestiolae]|uniref:SanA/YdcF family protein n=1 Tax=Carnimonas bestiolae TaxID=3402172 RepID=UPI003EDCA0DE
MKSAPLRMAVKIAGWTIAAGLALTLLAGAGFAAANLWVWYDTRDRIYTDSAMCPVADVGVVFGTSFRMRDGSPNPYYAARLDTAAELYRSGRVSHLLLSGDNRSIHYNEPIAMWRDLQQRHVPRSALTLDYAGLSTFDTVVRAKKIFGLQKVVLITQDWHLPRALFIARAKGLNAYGCAAWGQQSGSDTYVNNRELAARALTVMDVYLLGRKPRILGEPEPLKLSAEEPAD